MISITQRKSGFIRLLTTRLAFWTISQFATHVYRPGFLPGIGTIHFARWVTVPGSPISCFSPTMAGAGKAIWRISSPAPMTALPRYGRTPSAFRGRKPFPGRRERRRTIQALRKAEHGPNAVLVQRLSRELTTSIIRNNAEIRRGLSGTISKDEAKRWLALFGSAGRPTSKLDSSEIQSLVFGGLGFLRCGTCLFFDLPHNVSAARKWLAAIHPHIAFNDGRRLIGREAAVTLALSARGLHRLGLPPQGLATFPFAFLEGMTVSARARILGDVDKNNAESWAWGRTQPDVALLVYGEMQPGVAALAQMFINEAMTFGMTPPYEIPLKEVSESKEEPFGFVDGVSQPVIRGTYKGLATPIRSTWSNRANLSSAIRTTAETRRPGQRCRRPPILATSFRSSARPAASAWLWWKTTATWDSTVASWSSVCSSRMSTGFRRIAGRSA